MQRPAGVVDAQMKFMNLVHRGVRAVSFGRLGNTLGSMPVVELHATGRKSGKERVTMLTTPIQDDGTFVLVASKGGDDRDPEWYLNLVANPDIELVDAVRARRRPTCGRGSSRPTGATRSTPSRPTATSRWSSANPAPPEVSGAPTLQPATQAHPRRLRWPRRRSGSHRRPRCSHYRRGAVGKIYDSAEQFESLFTRMFADIADDDGMDTLVDQQMVICFRLRDPDVELWVDGRSKPVAASFGPQALTATLTATLTTDSMHELLLGTLPLGKALLFRKLKVKGSKSKAMKLESVLHAMQAVYPGLADEMLAD